MMKSDNPVISVVIPAGNARSTLKACLDGVFSAPNSNIEVIVVDDASEDETLRIAEKFNCVLIRLKKKSGPAVARNKGVEAAKGDIILFIDSDIIVNENTVPLVINEFLSDNELTAVVGILDENIPNKNLSSQFFNLRKRFDYLLINNDLSTIYTSITAIRKKTFIDIGGFNEKYSTASMEDAEIGRRLYRHGYKIRLNRNIKVIHLKYHTAKTLLASDLKRASHLVKFLMRERLAGDIVKEKRFGSFRLGSLITVPLVPAIILSFFISSYVEWFLPLLYIGVVIFLLANCRFLKFTGEALGWKMNMLMPLMIFIDSLAISAGIVIGIADYFMKGNRH